MRNGTFSPAPRRYGEDMPRLDEIEERERIVNRRRLAGRSLGFWLLLGFVALVVVIVFLLLHTPLTSNVPVAP